MPARTRTPATTAARAAAATVRKARERPTIVEVAKRAGVGISTVSRVLNGGRASDAVRRRVERAVKELGYAPSVAAQSLVGGRTGSIGLVVNSSQSPWFSQILVGIEEALAPSRHSVVIASMMLSGSYDPSTVERWLREVRVDGLILVRHASRDAPLLEQARQAGVPAVLIAPDLDVPDAFSVRSNNVEAGRLAAEHLVGLGHEHIVFSGGPPDSVDARQRLFGISACLRERGLNPPEAWHGTGYVRSVGVDHAEYFLALPVEKRPSAVILGNDSMALAFMRTLLKANVAIPGEVSVVGFDGTPDGEQCWPGLTTVEQSTRKMAAHACKVLLARLERADIEAATAVEYPVRLLVRESTAPRRACDTGRM